MALADFGGGRWEAQREESICVSLSPCSILWPGEGKMWPKGMGEVFLRQLPREPWKQIPASAQTWVRPQHSEVGGTWSGRGAQLSRAAFQSILSWRGCNQEPSPPPPSRRDKETPWQKLTGLPPPEGCRWEGRLPARDEADRAKGPRSLIPTPECQQGEQ